MDDLGQDGITAYHGSPHDFEQFDTSKIGTGEGAQSYGHGLYFAGHEPVAKGYRDALSGDPISQEGVKPDWRDKGSKSFAQLALAQSMDKKLSGDDAIHDAMQDLHKNAGLTERKDIKQRYYDAVNSLGQMLGKEWDIHKGHMYEVHINAHPHHMLDWDKPLSEQSSHITKSLFDARKEMPTLWEKTQHHINNDSTAGDFYQSIAAGHPHGYAGATDQLSRAGIKGIKYLDAGSRGDKAEPTHNYVVFDHNDVHIKRKYEQGGQVEGYAEGGDIMDDSRVKRTGEGGQESALDFIQNTPLYKQRMENQKQPQPQAASAPAPQTESKPMPVIAAPPPAIIRAAEPAPPAPVQQQPQAQGQTGLFHIGTNDTDSNMTVQSAQRIIESSRAMGINPVFLLPNQTARGLFNNPYVRGDDGLRVANNSTALQKYLDEQGIQYVMPEYNNKVDPYHMTGKWTQEFAKTYSNPFIVGDSNAVRLNMLGYKAKVPDGKRLIDTDSGASLSWGAQTSKTIANELEKHVKWYQQNKKNGGSVIHRMHFEDGGDSGDSAGGDDQGSSVGDPSSDFGGNDMGNDGGGGGGGNDNTPEPATTVDEKKPEEKTKPASPMPLTPQNMGTNLGYDPIPSATFTPATPTALPPTTSFQQFAGGGLVDAALKKVSSKYTDTGLPLNAMEILSKIARTG